MTPNAIVYTSNTGYTEQYAMLLGEPAIRYARTVEYGPATVHRIQWK